MNLPEFLIIDDVPRPTTNNLRRVIHPTEDGVRNFWRWFGNSKCIDFEGRPLVLFHGSSNFEGDAFTYDSKDINAYGDADLGFFFADQGAAGNFANEIGEYESPCLIPVYLRLESPHHIPGRDYIRMLDNLEFKDWHKFREERIAGNNDSVIVSTDQQARTSIYHHQFSSDNYIVFDPTTIKSAIGNSGRFDPASTSLTDHSTPDLVVQTTFDWTRSTSGSREKRVGDTTLIYGFNGHSAEVISLRTPASKRNKGAARAAMTQFLREADALGIPVKLACSPLDKRTKDARLFGFYASLGFAPTGKTINPAGDPEMLRPGVSAALKKDDPIWTP